MDLQKEEDGIPERKKQLHIDRGNCLVSFADCNISHFKGLNYEKLHLSGRTTVRTVKFHEVSVLKLPLFMARALYEDIASRLPAHSMISSTGSIFTSFALQQRLTAGYLRATRYPNSWMVHNGKIQFFETLGVWFGIIPYYTPFRDTTGRRNSLGWPGPRDIFGPVLLQGAEVELRVERWMRFLKTPGQFS